MFLFNKFTVHRLLSFQKFHEYGMEQGVFCYNRNLSLPHT